MPTAWSNRFRCVMLIAANVACSNNEQLEARFFFLSSAPTSVDSSDITNIRFYAALELKKKHFARRTLFN